MSLKYTPKQIREVAERLFSYSELLKEITVSFNERDRVILCPYF